jgi:hypothetical protein
MYIMDGAGDSRKLAFRTWGSSRFDGFFGVASRNDGHPEMNI